MFPRATFDNRLFAVNQQNWEITPARVLVRSSKPLVGLSAPTAPDNPRHPVFQTRLPKELRKTAPALGLKRLVVVATSLHVYLHGHQRFPPISPLRQSCPSP